MDILGGIVTIQIARWPLPQRQENLWPQVRRIKRFGSLFRGSAQILRGISRGLLPNPDGPTGRELEHVATRINGWLGIFGGCSALWFVLRGPQRWPLEDRSLTRSMRVLGVLSATGGLMQGVTDGVMTYPPRWKARLLRRVGSVLAFTSAVLLFAPLAIGIVRDNRRHGRQGPTRLPEGQRGKPREVAMEGWQEGQIFRMISHRMLIGNVSAGQPVALGIYDVELGHFKVTHEFDFEQPKVGEQMSLGHRRTHQMVTIRITGITHDAEDADQVIYTFRQV